MSLEAQLDGRLDRPVLVTGRRVPAGADLELVVLDEEGDRAVSSALQSLGLGRHGDTWARFHDCTADVATVTRLDRWRGGLPAGEPQRLMLDSTLIPGRERLRALALPDELLTLAMRFARDHRAPPAPIRAQLHRCLVAEPSGWVTAAERAVGWRAEAAVRLARDAYDGAHELTGEGRRQLAAEAGPALVPATGVIALSGLDGAGKSTQAHALAATLWKLGHDASVEWTRLSLDGRLDRIAAPVKSVLALRSRSRGQTSTDTAEASADHSARQLRGRSPLVNSVWTSVVAAVNGTSQRRTTLAQLTAGRVVVRDRYVLDSVVQLHSAYGDGQDVTRQARMVERLSPVPLAAFYLQVPPEVAYRRKPEEYSASELAVHAARYEQEADRLGVPRIDADRAPAELAAELAANVWRRLG